VGVGVGVCVRVCVCVCVCVCARVVVWYGYGVCGGMLVSVWPDDPGCTLILFDAAGVFRCTRT